MPDVRSSWSPTVIRDMPPPAIPVIRATAMPQPRPPVYFPQASASV